MLLSPLLLLLPLYAAAQFLRCATSEPKPDLVATHSNQSAIDAANRLNGVEATIEKHTVDTYIHIISSGKNESQGNIPDSKLKAQIDVLQKAFNGAGFAFAVKNVTRIERKEWFPLIIDGTEQTIKGFLRQGRYKDLNVYFDTISAGGLVGGGIIGFAYVIPYTFSSNNPRFRDDGVVVDPFTVPGGSLKPYNLGATLVHEVGHWLGLFHTFQPARDLYGIWIGDGCIGDGDYVWDTPAERSSASGCPIGRDTCKGESLSRDGKDPIHNYMDYSDDTCLNDFTEGQISRMQVLYKQLRVNRNWSPW
ncbi:hypothetical protein B0O99DRAFT_584917 [Bisporella sp. PMI_857]|nr:hypothetical protein B0O99DRAFT_584917 [Bisporella sp. PMI_857]